MAEEDASEELCCAFLAELDSDSEDNEAFDDVLLPGVTQEALSALRERGACAIDGAFGERLSLALHRDVETLRDSCLLCASPNALATGELDGKITRALLVKRGVLELNSVLDGKPCVTSECDVAARLLCPALRALATGAGAELARRVGAALGCELCVDEIKAQFQSEGGCFPCHYDTSPGTRRVVTAILYLNEDWEAAHGGELRLLPLGAQALDIAPVFDRLALFSSSDALHRTLPSRAPRFAVSIWLGCREARSKPALEAAWRERRATSSIDCDDAVTRCVRCSDTRATVAAFAFNSTTRCALAKLAPCDEYRRSFEDAFADCDQLRSALALDEHNNACARAALERCGTQQTPDALLRLLEDLRHAATCDRVDARAIPS